MPATPPKVRPHHAVLGLIGIVAAFVAGEQLLAGNDLLLRAWADLLWALAALVAGVQCWRVARRLPPTPLRRSWRFFGLASFSWFAGMLVWAYLDLVAGWAIPFPSASDIGFLLFAPLMSAGLAQHRARLPNGPFALMEISQLGILIACIAIALTVALHPRISAQSLTTGYFLTAVAYPALYLALLVQAVTTLWLHTEPGARQPLALVVAGVAVHTATDSLYAYQLLGGQYATGEWLDSAWLIGFGFIFVGAQLQLGAGRLPSTTHTLPRSLRLDALIPIAALLLTLATVLVFSQQLTPDMLGLLLPGSLILLVFLALREWASDEIQSRLDAAVRDSEARLQALTGIAPVGIFRADVLGRWIYTNERWQAISGLTPEESLGTGWMRALHGEHRERVARAWRDCIATGRDFKSEFRLTQTTAAPWVLAQVVAERNADGAITGYVGSITDIDALKATELALHESEARFRRSFESSPIMMTITHLDDGRFLDANPAFEQVTGWSAAEAVGCTASDLKLWMEPADRDRLLALTRSEGTLRGLDWRLRHKSGKPRDVLASVERIHLGGEDCLLVVAQDITDRKRTEADMLKLSSALEQTADAVMITDRVGLIEYVNPAFEAVTGYTFGEIRGQRPSLLKSGKQGPDFYRKLWTTVLAGEVFSEVFVNRRKTGDLYYEEKTITPLRDESGAITHFVATARDITERMHTQERLEFMAHHDALTELPNRALFLDRLRQALARARWHGRLVAVMFLDIDRFKTINDSLGHDIGDRLLQELAGRLGRCLRERDTVARFGGDEFVILLDDMAAARDVATLARKILHAMVPPVDVGEQVLHVTASIGISLYPEDGEDSVSLLRHADAAMYRAKDLGRNTYQFYSAEMGERSLERLTLENHLRTALEARQFLLHYQPQIDMASGRLVGVEALLRWRHPELGLQAPAEFVPLLEDTGMILPVGLWVLETACAQASAWHRLGWREPRVAVNVAGRQLHDPGLARLVRQMLTRHGLQARFLELEITETTLVDHNPATAATLAALNQLGVRLSIDDFGTGYSSLAYLRRFPVDTLKIDRGFLQDVPADADNAAITRAIVSLGQSLRLELVAEGVETQEQSEFLQSLGCQLGQGYFFHHPMPADEISAMLTGARSTRRQSSQE